MDPTRMRFSMSEPRKLIEDEDNRGLNCVGCLFRRQRASVCRVASEEAIARGMRDCDAVDQFGDVVVYVEYHETQQDLFGGTDVQKT
jgi:hypothetical protein